MHVYPRELFCSVRDRFGINSTTPKEIIVKFAKYHYCLSQRVCGWLNVIGIFWAVTTADFRGDLLGQQSTQSTGICDYDCTDV